MSHAKKPPSTTWPLRNLISRERPDDPCSDEIRSIRADVQLLLEIIKRKKALETTRPRTASVTPTLNLVLARARDTVNILTTQLQTNTGENTQIRMCAVSISHSLAFDVSSTLRLFATIIQTASSLERATGISEGNAKPKPLPLDTSLWILKRLLPFVRTVIQAKQTLLHPIHQLPVELLADIFLQVHKLNLDSTNDIILVGRLKSGRMVLPSQVLSTVFILGSVSSCWRKIVQSLPTILASVTVSNNRLPPWWRKSLTSNAIDRRGIDFFICVYNTNAQLNDTMNDVKFTWVRSLTIKRYDWGAFLPSLERGPLSRLEELNFTPSDTNSELFTVPNCLSETLRTLIVHECIPTFSYVFPMLRKLSIIYTKDEFSPDWQPDWRTLAIDAPYLEELTILHRSAYPWISALSTTAKAIELNWSTIRSFAAISPELLKIHVERMRVRIENVVPDSKGSSYRLSNGSSLMEVIWNGFFTTTGLGHMVQKLTLCGYLCCDTWSHNPLQPFTGLRILEVEGWMGKSLMNSLLIKDSGTNVAPDAEKGGRSGECKDMAVACPNLERLILRDISLDGDVLMKAISERNNSIWVLNGKVRLLKHIEIWNCSGVSAETRRRLRLLREQDAQAP